jgi:uncharacterized OsmC-like protein
VVRRSEGEVRILIESENAVSVRGGDALAIEATDERQPFAPFHMLAAGLATCTYSVLYTWAATAELDAAELAVHVEWTFADEPQRVDAFDMRIEWPSLPAARREAARKVAEQCTVHHTLAHGAEVRTTVGAG